MTNQPAVGTTFKDGEYYASDNRLFDRGPLCAVLVRDNQGAATNISPYLAGTPPTKNFWPLAEDGQLRDDLFADKLKDGQWETNPDSNEGWWRVGALDERGGPDRKPSIKHDDQMVLQSNFPYDTDLTGEGITIQFTAIEQFKPALARLLMNLPLTDSDGNSVVEDVGADDYALSKPVDADSVDRQLLLVFARKRPGGFVYCVEGYPLVKLTDIGNKKRSKTDPDASSLTFTALPSAYHTDIDASNPDAGEVIPAFYTRWVGGDAWSALQYVGSP